MSKVHEATVDSPLGYSETELRGQLDESRKRCVMYSRMLDAAESGLLASRTVVDEKNRLIKAREEWFDETMARVYAENARLKAEIALMQSRCGGTVSA